MQIFRYEIPMDGTLPKEHKITLHGPIVHVAMRNPYNIELWAEYRGNAWERDYHFAVVGTGMDVPDSNHVRTVFDPDLRHVWHVRELKK